MPGQNPRNLHSVPGGIDSKTAALMQGMRVERRTATEYVIWCPLHDGTVIEAPTTATALTKAWDCARRHAHCASATGAELERAHISCPPKSRARFFG